MDQAKKLMLLRLCDGWGRITTYGAATGAAISPNRLHPIVIQIPDTHCTVKSDNPVSEIIVEGYTDSLDDYIYNKNLSKSRADVIKNICNNLRDVLTF